jgi:hypothetical protein
MNLAKLMHNALTVEEVSAYLYWELFWASPSGLVSLTSPTPTINSIYYAFKHYSYFTDPNWQRVDANTNSSNLRISAFISPNNRQLSAIILNTSTSDINLSLSFNGFNIADGNVWRSSSTKNCLLSGSFNPAAPIIIEANSITTIALNSTAPDTTPPAAPTGLVAITGTDHVVLDWNDNIETDLAGYNIYRAETHGSGYGKLNTSLVTASDYNDDTITVGTTYYYVVTAVDTNNNESAYSNESSSEYNCAWVQANGFGISEDLNGDCYVDSEDLAIIAQYWLSTISIDCAGNPLCQKADLVVDDHIDFFDFSDFALQWLICNDPQNPDCTPTW